MGGTELVGGRDCGDYRPHILPYPPTPRSLLTICPPPLASPSTRGAPPSPLTYNPHVDLLGPVPRGVVELAPQHVNHPAEITIPVQQQQQQQQQVGVGGWVVRACSCAAAAAAAASGGGGCVGVEEALVEGRGGGISGGAWRRR